MNPSVKGRGVWQDVYQVLSRYLVASICFIKKHNCPDQIYDYWAVLVGTLVCGQTACQVWPYQVCMAGS